MYQPTDQRPVSDPRSSPLRWGRWLAVTFALLAVIGASLAGWVSLAVHRPQDHAGVNLTLTVSRGMTANQIYEQLRRQGILPNSLMVKYWFRFKAGSDTLKAGDYRFASPITPAAVWNKLAQGDISFQTVTLPEGLTRFEMSQRIEALDIPGAENALQLTEHPDLLALIRDLDPEAKTVEGYLFPDTYQYTSTTTAAQLMRTMIERFRQVYTPEHRHRTKALGLTVRAVVTLASMIEREAKLREERPLISSVYHNRLRRGMKLDCDPTVIYASMLAGKWSGVVRRSDLERRSPYNTYIFPGLPPGPIASPGRASIEAALYPAHSDHLFFVVDASRSDGAHLFSSTSRQHEANVNKLRMAERRRAGQKPPSER